VTTLWRCSHTIGVARRNATGALDCAPTAALASAAAQARAARRSASLLQRRASSHSGAAGRAARTLRAAWANRSIRAPTLQNRFTPSNNQKNLEGTRRAVEGFWASQCAAKQRLEQSGQWGSGGGGQLRGGASGGGFECDDDMVDSPWAQPVSDGLRVQLRMLCQQQQWTYARMLSDMGGGIEQRQRGVTAVNAPPAHRLPVRASDSAAGDVRAAGGVRAAWSPLRSDGPVRVNGGGASVSPPRQIPIRSRSTVLPSQQPRSAVPERRRRADTATAPSTLLPNTTAAWKSFREWMR
jgi:hypothetical protein